MDKDLKEREVRALEKIARELEKKNDRKRDKHRGELTLGSSPWAIARGYEFFKPGE